MSDDQKTQNVYKITLSSGRIVHLREMKIKFQNLASQAIGSKAGDNSLLMATLMQQELLKVLLIDIDGSPVKPIALENLDDLFTYSEYSQLSKVVGKLMGGDEGECQTEIASIGKP